MTRPSSLALGVRLGYYISRTTYCHLSPGPHETRYSVNGDDITQLNAAMYFAYVA